MKRRHQFNSVVILTHSAQASNGDLVLQQALNGKFAQGNNDLRPYEIDLLLEKGLTRFDFVGLRIAVLRRATFDHVGDVDVSSLKPHPLGDDIGQELSCAADE